MFTFEQIKELVDLVSTRKLGGLEVERSGFRLRIDGKETGGLPPSQALEAPALPVSEAPVIVRPEPVAEVAEEQTEPEGHILTSPIVGTFYTAPNPAAPPFAAVGDRVKKGQVLCIVEAMKLMNEIESDVDGVISKVFPSDAQPVEFGEKLFAITSD